LIFLALLRLYRVLELTVGKIAIALHNTRQMMKGIKNLLINRRCVEITTCVIAGLLQACMPFALGKYGPDDQSREEFEQRVEAAFRLQNRMTSEVMVLQEGDVAAKDQEAILQAEQLMEKNCNYLNEYVSRDIDGLNKGLFLQRHVEKSVLDCETAARNVEALLKAR
jgi:hypothetical protein